MSVLHRGTDPPGANLRFSASILIASPVFRGAEFVGILGGGLDFKKIYERFVHPMHSGVQAGSWMINQEGRFIAHYDPSLLGKDAFTARKERDPDLSSERIDRIMKEKMLAGKAGMDEYVSGWHMGERGKIKKLIAYAPIRLDGQVWSVARGRSLFRSDPRRLG